MGNGSLSALPIPLALRYALPVRIAVVAVADPAGKGVANDDPFECSLRFLRIHPVIRVGLKEQLRRIHEYHLLFLSLSLRQA